MANAEPTVNDSAGREAADRISSSSPPQVIRLPTSSSEPPPNTARTTYHIYDEKEKHKRILSTVDLKHESSFSAVKRAARKAKKDAKAKGTVIKAEAEAEPSGNEDAFFLHSPYLAFHSPPMVLYTGVDKHASPAMLIHGGAFWKTYKLQYGYSIATPGVLDPRGVVSWKHNGGDKKALKADDKMLKGYKVRTWRLWGETGKAYVHGVKANRKAGIGPDPDILEDPKTGKREVPARADGVVHLKWERPFSRHTRCYHFHYSNIDFYWKGTGTVKKSNFCGMFVRYNHLKLVAKLPASDLDKNDRPEACLARYTSSITSKKCGRLELYDTAILRLTEEYVQPIGEIGVQEDETILIKRLKRTILYKIIVGTALCMINAEKEKRQAVGQFLQNAGEGGGG